MFNKLFSPIKIRDLELKNRIVMSAMGTHSAVITDTKKGVSDKLIAYHVARAKGGSALNIVEVSSVDKYSSPESFLSIADDSFIGGLKKLNDAVHAVGGKTGIQLWQGGLAVASDRTAQILLPNDMPLSKEYTVPGITEERLLSVINAFGEAAKRAVEAGFDCLEFHCAHNYLPHSMLSGGINHRNDAWGGSFKNRERFPLECIKAIRKNMPEGMPLFMRVDCHDDFLENGLTLEEVIAFCKDAKEAGVDVVDVSRGNILTAATIYEVAPIGVPNGFNVEDAKKIRQETGLLTMPCGRINTPEYAEEILESGKADLVVIARGQLADPEFANKAKEGKVDEIRYCLGCDQGCYDAFCAALYGQGEHITCTRNPAVLEEATRSLKKTNNPKKVAIIGGGIAGLEAAIDLKLTGNTPVIYEKSNVLGGQMILSGKIKGKEDFTKALEKTIKYVNKLGIEIHLNSELNASNLSKEKYDAYMIATGAENEMITLSGQESGKCISPKELMNNEKINAKNAIVYGGTNIGYECAMYLVAKGVKVSLVEESENILSDLYNLRKIIAQMSLSQGNVTIMPSTTIKSINVNKVTLDTKGEEKVVDGDLIVVATSRKPLNNDKLVSLIEEQGIPYYVLGDAKKPSTILNAIHSAYNAVLDLNNK